MRHIWKTLFLIMACYTHNVFANDLLCPPGDQVKNVKLIAAFQHPFDETQWNFASNAITYNNQQWNVWFGTFLPEAKNATEALKQGQAYFDQAAIIIKQPHSYPGGRQHILCDYVPEGHEYWISTVNPPEVMALP